MIEINSSGELKERISITCKQFFSRKYCWKYNLEDTKIKDFLRAGKAWNSSENHGQLSVRCVYALSLWNWSLLLYFCSCFWTSKSSLLRRLFWPLHLCVSLLLIPKRKVFTLNFFCYVPSPLSWTQKREGHSKQKKRIFTK